MPRATIRTTPCPALPRYLALLISAILSVAACHAAPDEPPEPPQLSVPVDDGADDDIPSPSVTLAEPSGLQVKTSEGSGQLVHPDAVVFPKSWNGRRFWFAATPYPGGNATYENPSIFQGASTAELTVPAGVTNPLANPTNGAYLSDPDLVYDPVKDELRMYYRQTTADADQLYLVTSRNGVQWTSQALIQTDTRYAMISPAIVREEDGSWRMWAVTAGPAGCNASTAGLTLNERRSADGLKWGSPTPVSLVIPGRVPWHWDVQYISSKHEYWALVAAYPNGDNCSRSEVYFARSTDGTRWVASPSPVLARGVSYPLRDIVYRSTFKYFAPSDMVAIWFSGARLQSDGYHYAVASARYTLTELMRRVETPNPSASQSRGSEEQAPGARAAREAFVRAFP
ncbi:MAG: hypothetical protein ABJE10_00220 [bacterium]